MSALSLVFGLTGRQQWVDPGYWRTSASEQCRSGAHGMWRDFEVAVVSVGMAVRLQVSCLWFAPAVGHKQPVAAHLKNWPRRGPKGQVACDESGPRLRSTRPSAVVHSQLLIGSPISSP